MYGHKTSARHIKIYLFQTMKKCAYLPLKIDIFIHVFQFENHSYTQPSFLNYIEPITLVRVNLSNNFNKINEIHNMHVIYVKLFQKSYLITSKLFKRQLLHFCIMVCCISYANVYPLFLVGNLNFTSFTLIKHFHVYVD